MRQGVVVPPEKHGLYAGAAHGKKERGVLLLVLVLLVLVLHGRSTGGGVEQGERNCPPSAACITGENGA